MGSVVKGRGGRWKAKYRDSKGLQKYKTFHKYAEARRFVGEMESSVRKGEWIDPKLAKIQFSEWIGQWWPTTVNLRPSTRVRDEAYLRNYILPWFGRQALEKITPLDIRSWVAALVADGLAPATVRKAYQILSKAMRAAVDADFLIRTPCRAISLPEINPKETRFLTPQEIARLAEAIDPRFRALVLVAAYSGLRWGELIALRPEHIDIAEGTLQVTETVVEVNGQIQPPGPPKTRAGRRKVPLPRGVARELATHIDNRKPSCKLVFPAPNGGYLLRATFRQRFWLPALDKAGCIGLRVHDLRHTAVALWIAAGAHVKEIQARAGHTSAAVVLDRYGHLFPSLDQRLNERLDEMYNSSKSEAPPGQPFGI